MRSAGELTRHLALAICSIDLEATWSTSACFTWNASQLCMYASHPTLALNFR
jgi:hypothetical protein